MEKQYRQLRPYQGVILLLLSLVVIFWISPLLSIRLGLYGTFLGELLLLGLSVLVVVAFGGSLRANLPIRKPTAAGVFGTILLWLGTFMGVMILTLAITAAFPQEMMGTSSALGEAFTSVPFLLSMFIVAITPAICEEAVFRGVVLHSFKPLRSKWLIIVLTGIIFGAFHGSIWRFVPTALLGMMLGYLMMETDNMVYNGLFHCINNAVPIILLYAVQGVYAGMSTGDMTSEMDSMSILALGVYVMYGAVIPFSIYVGNYLIHRGVPGYRQKLFPSGKPWIIILLILLTAAFILAGLIVIVVALVSQPGILEETMDNIARSAGSVIFG
ncbi:type II CAAX endopeptidase family protein [Hespellia stercorisuis]|uniref:CAAX protease self-immunity n=1 Tax=Hespellia stercorisuis DSM 15480 TaxID=1121950 RepID=A0A1M6LDF9_9FIRM|nr:type II CAAX endopeptidase family protein [Hespellia stercorisuis]SHJ69240.1 CAAX protease self-immunity [Hespellia stercorisuis DSM 15480]